MGDTGGSYKEGRLMKAVRWVVADAGLLKPEAGTVGLDKISVDLWIAHDDEERKMVTGLKHAVAEHRGKTIGTAMEVLRWDHDREITKSDVLFLVRRVGFVSAFKAPEGTTCGTWTRVIDNRGHKGFFKASAATGWCPVRCQFCYLISAPYAFQALALNVGEYARQIARKKAAQPKRLTVVNLGETGGLLEWCVELGIPELVQAYIDATVEAGVTPYILTKRTLPNLDLSRAHVGISLNPAAISATVSPGADGPGILLDFLADAKGQGASTVVRWGPIYPGHNILYEVQAEQIHRMGLADRITVDLLRFSNHHPGVSKWRARGFVFRAHKWQESAPVQGDRFVWVRSLFPGAVITGCKLDAAAALPWVREGLIQAMPCACWV